MSAMHVERSHGFELEMEMERALALFTPEGERAWAKGWEPRYLQPADGSVRAGMVFTTRHGGEETVWTMLEHDPDGGLVEYARVTPGSRMGTVRVRCAPIGATRTRVDVTYALTALSESGSAHLREFDAGYEAFIASWASSIREATTT